ncbi:hypothetical protein PN498_28155 [Oscillatoria sp. CS-180]|uniref:hypothetical protein n=1 Tax=Oscillatoria sp. CS-180 TaxID=3021720 RepID=UPI00232C0FE1|nr:hypothetical protein [Oscillatoria sp. CS-180]MDB9529892.1 hypothetical protein [Oscillatoria sp. CS-180]
MNTPSHSILNLAILGRAQQPMMTWPILMGSWLPDAALFGFYGWAKLANIPEATIWRETYYEPIWQDIFAVGNSIPLALIGLGVFAWQQRLRIAVMFASMLLHHLEDLPLHHDDAHRHFWPLSDYRFVSPISYWDSNHWAIYGAFAELVLTLLATAILLRRVQSSWGKGLLIIINVIYVFGYYSFYLRSNL